jgi:hypothetical protein
MWNLQQPDEDEIATSSRLLEHILQRLPRAFGVVLRESCPRRAPIAESLEAKDAVYQKDACVYTVVVPVGLLAQGGDTNSR